MSNVRAMLAAKIALAAAARRENAEDARIIVIGPVSEHIAHLAAQAEALGVKIEVHHDMDEIRGRGPSIAICDELDDIPTVPIHNEPEPKMLFRTPLNNSHPRSYRKKK